MRRCRPSAAGALIAKVGDGAPFPIADSAAATMPAAGQLFLGINDGRLADNTGSFRVTVQRSPAPVIAAFQPRLRRPHDTPPVSGAIVPRHSGDGPQLQSKMGGYPWPTGRILSTCPGPTFR